MFFTVQGESGQHNAVLGSVVLLTDLDVKSIMYNEWRSGVM